MLKTTLPRPSSKLAPIVASVRKMCPSPRLRDRVGSTDIDAGEIAAGDEVHNTGDRIGTVSGGGAARQHVHTLDESDGDVVEIDAAEQFARNDADAVEKHDVAVGAEAAKVDEGGAAVAVVNGRTDARHDARQLAQDLFGDIGLLEFELVLADDRDRARGNEVRVADESAGDDDFAGAVLFDGIGRLLALDAGGWTLRPLRVLSEGRRRGERHTGDHRRGEQSILEECLRHSSPP
jgi:hypothetical protein